MSPSESLEQYFEGIHRKITWLKTPKNTYLVKEALAAYLASNILLNQYQVAHPEAWTHYLELCDIAMSEPNEDQRNQYELMMEHHTAFVFDMRRMRAIENLMQLKRLSD